MLEVRKSERSRKTDEAREGGWGKPQGNTISIWCLIGINFPKPMKISQHSYIHCTREVVKAACTRKRQKVREREIIDAWSVLTLTSEASGEDAIGEKLWVLIFLNNDLFTHLMATIPAWNIQSPQNKLWLFILSLTWSPHDARN